MAANDTILTFELHHLNVRLTKHMSWGVEPMLQRLCPFWQRHYIIDSDFIS